MKTLLVIAALCVVGFYGYRHWQEPAEIVNPVYAEIRVTMNVGGREIEAAFFGKAADEADCNLRAQKSTEHLEANCKYCVTKSVECKTDLAPRYAKFFDDVPSNVTYLSINHSNRAERDARLIFWGLTGEEGDAVCDQMKQVFAKIHKGPMKCVRAIDS